MSRAWLATSFFNRAFSASRSLSRFASLAFMPPYWASQRCHVDSAICRCRHTTWRSSLAGPQELVALGELADDLIRRMPPALVRCHVVADSSLPEHRATESHNDWTTAHDGLTSLLLFVAAANQALPEGASHFVFGHGVHRCLGAQLTHVEMHAALRGDRRALPALHPR